MAERRLLGGVERHLDALLALEGSARGEMGIVLTESHFIIEACKEQVNAT